MSAFVIPSSFSTPSSTGSPWVSHPALRCTWKPFIVLYLLKVSFMARARTWCIPGCPFAEGGPSKKTNCGQPSRSSTERRNMPLLFHFSSISSFVFCRSSPPCSANFPAAAALSFFSIYCMSFYQKQSCVFKTCKVKQNNRHCQNFSFKCYSGCTSHNAFTTSVYTK